MDLVARREQPIVQIKMSKRYPNIIEFVRKRFALGG